MFRIPISIRIGPTGSPRRPPRVPAVRGPRKVSNWQRIPKFDCEPGTAEGSAARPKTSKSSDLETDRTDGKPSPPSAIPGTGSPRKPWNGEQIPKFDYEPGVAEGSVATDRLRSRVSDFDADQPGGKPSPRPTRPRRRRSTKPLGGAANSKSLDSKFRKRARRRRRVRRGRPRRNGPFGDTSEISRSSVDSGGRGAPSDSGTTTEEEPGGTSRRRGRPRRPRRPR